VKNAWKMMALWRETSGKIMVYYGLLVSDGGRNPNPRNWRKPLDSILVIP